MQKCLAVAASIAASNILGSLIFLSLAKPSKWNAWPAFGAYIQPLDPQSYLNTPGEVMAQCLRVAGAHCLPEPQTTPERHVHKAIPRNAHAKSCPTGATRITLQAAVATVALLPVAALDTDDYAAQVCAVIFLHLFILLQFSIVLTRNPSFFWKFGKKTAPPPSIFLLLPVCVFTIGATFVAVYWPASVQPDGGRGEFEGAGLSSAHNASQAWCTMQHGTLCFAMLMQHCKACQHRGVCLSSPCSPSHISTKEYELAW